MNVLAISLADIRRIAPQRPHHLLMRLSEQHDITVASVPARHLPLRRDVIFEELEKRVRLVDLDVGGAPSYAAEQVAGFGQRWRALAGAYHPDVVLSFHATNLPLKLSRHYGIPLVFDLCDDLGDWAGSSEAVPKVLRPLARAVATRRLRRILRAADHVVYSTPTLARKYAIPRRRSTLVPNGVDATKFIAASGDHRSAEGPVVGFVGFLGHWVALERVIEALQDPRLADSRLLVVGGGPRLEHLRQHANELGLRERVTFTGEIPYEAVPRAVSGMDVCVLPFDESQTSLHAVPLKLFEYLACGKAVVSSPLPAVVELAGTEVLFARDPDEYADQIVAARALIGRSAERRDFVVRHFGWDQLASRFDAAIQEAAQVKPR